MSKKAAAEKAAHGLDQSNLEDAVQAAVEKRIGDAPSVFPSANFGVVAIERLHLSFGKRIDWQEIAAELARETQIGVLCVASCDWTFDDQPDEEAILIAFDLPTVPEGYRDDHRNAIVPVSPKDAPLQVHFDELHQAEDILDAHVKELTAHAEMLKAARKRTEPVMKKIEGLKTLRNEILASDRDQVKAVLDFEFDRALELAVKVTSEPAPDVAAPRP